MNFKLLGTAAGGGFPQWNCACTLCDLCRNFPDVVRPRLQLQAAFSTDAEKWFLINASPDLRFQIESNPELQPKALHGKRNTPIQGIILTTADLDQVLGLLLLRESTAYDLLHRRSPPYARSEQLFSHAGTRAQTANLGRNTSWKDIYFGQSSDMYSHIPSRISSVLCACVWRR
jgi:phosphoribosyl 1,2-cyclic phosphodiesterase